LGLIYEVIQANVDLLPVTQILRPNLRGLVARQTRIELDIHDPIDKLYSQIFFMSHIESEYAGEKIDPQPSVFF
jgi:hypothetical protein